MYVKQHIILSWILFALLYFYFHLPLMYALISSLSSILIDFDHYIIFVIIERNLNLKEAIRWHVNKKECVPLLFHTTYTIIGMLILAYFMRLSNNPNINVIFLIWISILLGMLYHLFFDEFWALLGMLNWREKKEGETKKEEYKKLINRLFLINKC